MVDPNPGNDVDTDTDPLPPVDFGDAPDASVGGAWNYPTTVGDGGAGHGLGSGRFLGAAVDAESDGQPSAAASGDDLGGSDDEDGVALPAQFVPCTTAVVGVTVSMNAFVNGWIDFNNYGDWSDSGEWVIADYLQTAGIRNDAVAVPCTALPTARTYSRFRASNVPGVGVGGLTSQGEVEDYAVEVVQIPDPLQVLTASAAGVGSVQLQWINPDEPYAATSIWARTYMFPAIPNEIGARLVAVRSGTAGGPTRWSTSAAPKALPATTQDSPAIPAKISPPARTSPPRPPSDSAIAWVYSTGAASLVPPSPLPGIAAFTASNDRRLHSFDSATGLWPSGWTPPLMNEPAQGRSPVVNLPTTTIGGTGAVIFAGSQDGHVYAFDASDGSELWQSAEELGSEVQAAPSVMFTDFGAPFNLVVASARDLAGAATVYGLDPSDGSTVWSFDNGGGEENAIGVVSAQASLNWSTSPPRAFFASRAHSTGSSDTAWCLELAAGSASLLWSQPVGDSDGAASLSGGAVYVWNRHRPGRGLGP